ncbi:MAG TPA: serine hydrolase domain-containing protein [Thermoanaerobaculia bacterium]|nr:serine hydrolase domain-containing protein [Thermoanaerobaculia bacterium]
MSRGLSRRALVLNSATVLAGGLGTRRAAFGGAPAPVARSEAWIPSEAMLDRLPGILELASVPGLSIAVVDAGAVVWEGSFGVGHATAGGPVDGGTVFEAASLSKPLVAYVALILHQEGKLDLDRPMLEIFPQPSLGPDPALRKITPRHVLSHSSGLPNWRPSPEGISTAFEPGSAFGYSGEGFVWLQRTLEHVAGQPFPALMRERLLRPLGLSVTSFVRGPEHEASAAVGHSYRGDPLETYGMRAWPRLHELARAWKRPVAEWRYEDSERAAREIDPSRPPVPDNILPNAASSLVTTAVEYARFLAHLLDPDSSSGPALRPELRLAMGSPQVVVSGPLAWGIGWGLEARTAVRWLWHWGDNGSFKTFAVADPASRRGLVVLANGMGGRKVYERVVSDAVGTDLASLVWV